MTFTRPLLAIIAVGSLSSCASAPDTLKLERFAGQWDSDIAASYFWANDGRCFGLWGPDPPKVMVDFQEKQPVYRHGSVETIAYYEVIGWLESDHIGTPNSGVDHRLHITQVLHMERMRRNLPPFVQPHH